MNESVEQAGLLLSRARDDAFMMRELLKNPQSPKWGIGFHAQQAIEKAIKAVLCARGVRYPFTHDLKLLLNLLNSSDIPSPPNEKGILDLMPYGTTLRYDMPAAQDEAKLDAKRVQQVVDSVLDWARPLVRQRS